MSTVTTIHRALIRGMALGAAELRQRARSNKENEVIIGVDGSTLPCNNEQLNELLEVRRKRRETFPLPKWFGQLSERERDRVQRYVVRIEFTRRHWPYSGAQPALYARGMGPVANLRTVGYCAPMTGEWRGYEKPNGGHRILPSGYTRITEHWVRSNGTTIRPVYMNTGHLENTMKLLKESHTNFIGKANDMLGRIAEHLDSRPDLQHMLTVVARDIEQIDVDELYPIWKDLSKAAQDRPQEQPPMQRNESSTLGYDDFPF